MTDTRSPLSPEQQHTQRVLVVRIQQDLTRITLYRNILEKDGAFARANHVIQAICQDGSSIALQEKKWAASGHDRLLLEEKKSIATTLLQKWNERSIGRSKRLASLDEMEKNLNQKLEAMSNGLMMTQETMEEIHQALETFLQNEANEQSKDRIAAADLECAARPLIATTYRSEIYQDKKTEQPDANGTLTPMPTTPQLQRNTAIHRALGVRAREDNFYKNQQETEEGERTPIASSPTPPPSERPSDNNASDATKKPAPF